MNKPSQIYLAGSLFYLIFSLISLPTNFPSDHHFAGVSQYRVYSTNPEIKGNEITWKIIQSRLNTASSYERSKEKRQRLTCFLRAPQLLTTPPTGARGHVCLCDPVAPSIRFRRSHRDRRNEKISHEQQ